MAVQDLKRMPQQEVAQRAQDIWTEFLAEGAPSSINLDSHSYERTSQNLKDPGRYSYEDAQVRKYNTGRKREGISIAATEAITIIFKFSSFCCVLHICRVLMKHFTVKLRKR